MRHRLTLLAVVACLLVAGLPSPAVHAQLGDVFNDLKRQAEQAAKRSADRAVDEVVDCAFGDEKCVRKAQKQGKQVRVAPAPGTAGTAAAETSAKSAVPVAGQPVFPPGWKSYDPYPEELSFVAPQATTRLADAPRTLSHVEAPAPGFRRDIMSPRIIVDNPYLDPADSFFNMPRAMACGADGSLAVFSTAKLHKDGRFQGNPYASGAWRIAPDGAITPIGAKHIIVEGSGYYPLCGVPFAKSSAPADVGPVTRAPDGSLVFPLLNSSTVLRLTADGRVHGVPDLPGTCAKPGSAGYVASPFSKPSAVVQDPRGNLWVSDLSACSLSRMSPDGHVTTVLTRERACPPGDPENTIFMERLVWDPVHDELVIGGSLLWLKAPKANNYSTIWRVTPDGQPRRVYLGRKLGQGELVDGVTSIAVDAGGRVVFGAGNVRGGGSLVRRLDEATGTSKVIAGANRPTDINHGDGPAREAYFGTIQDLCYVPDGTLFIRDANHTIRKLSRDGQVTTWAF